MIELHQVCAGYGSAPVLNEISFTVPKGSFTTLIGPNGCGKTTLLRAAAGQLPLSAGEIRLHGLPLSAYSRKALAQTAAFMPQTRSIPAITVEALVSHGRFPYLGFSRRMSSRDRDAVRQAMADAGVSQWAGRDLRALSGGERQRAYLAMVLAQDTDIVFLDEPTTYLDLRHQFELLDLVEDLNRREKTVVMVLHDLGHALSRSRQLVLMDQGRVIRCGTPEELCADGALEQVFHVHVHRAAQTYYVTP